MREVSSLFPYGGTCRPTTRTPSPPHPCLTLVCGVLRLLLHLYGCFTSKVDFLLNVLSTTVESTAHMSSDGEDDCHVAASSHGSLEKRRPLHKHSRSHRIVLIVLYGRFMLRLTQLLIHLFSPAWAVALHSPNNRCRGQSPKTQNSKQPAIPYGSNQWRPNNSANA